MKIPWKHGIAAAIILILLPGMSGSAYATGGHYSRSPEYLYYMEGTGAYFLPDPEVDIFFSLGRWYRRSGSSWSVSTTFSGPWGAVSLGGVPTVLVNLPVDFRLTHTFGLVPSRHVLKGRSSYDYGPRYYDDHDSRRYRRGRHQTGSFWFFIAPDLDHHWDDDDWDDDRRDDDGHRRRRRGRGKD
jgi:hypothetical protein